ncbi:DUF438 domain-containing protein [Methanobrevibacter sp. 87.7]|uniref:DUF438 domain-containing protein n=1 Tax=Methanobrevibacter sp. 87.7 TaxID=387957 RepID=UPI000B50314E|nr:DUF438 domain-containing protein [Methanobrevibacter sp. 87.7]
MKTLDLNKPVAELIKEYPEVKDIMVELGFKAISQNLQSMGQIITIPKGSKIKNIPLDKIIKKFEDEGFEVINKGEPEVNKEKANNSSERVELLKSYITRLSNGEPLENIQEEFKDNFRHVSAKEIAKAEQTLIEEGFNLNDVQRLCDVHSALFHEMTDSERMEMLEAEMELGKQDVKNLENENNEGVNKSAEYMKIEGHPINVLILENNEISSLVNNIEKDLDDGKSALDVRKNLKVLKNITKHYSKKDNLLFPLLKGEYNFPGPSDVMWGVEDEILDTLSGIIHETEGKEEEIKKVLKRIKEMIYKEENILFPLCAEYFKKEEWVEIARDFNEYGPCLINEIPKWDEINENTEITEVNNDKIYLPGGTITLKQLRVVLNLLPVEITIIDENDINRFFDEGEKLFERPHIALNKEVYSCHPKKVEPVVRSLIEDFKSGKRDSMHVLGSKRHQKVLINYYALRDEENNYLGTMEAVLPLESIINILNDDKKGPVDY